MKLGVPKERRADETRVAASPESVRKLSDLGFDVVVEAGAGDGSSFADEAYRAAGAEIGGSEDAVLRDADVVLKVQVPLHDADGEDELSLMKSGAILIANLSALSNPEAVAACAERGLTTFAMELLPRITRAQSMDVLSSQSNLAGYRAVVMPPRRSAGRFR